MHGPQDRGALRLTEGCNGGMVQYLWLIPIGFVVGTYGTLIGAGGGFVLMPVLLLLYPKEPANLLASISLAVVFLNASSGSAAYAVQRRIDYRAGLLFAAATIPSAVVGALVTSLIPRRVFDLLFGAVMIAGAAFLALVPPGGSGRGGVRLGPEVTHVLTDRAGATRRVTFSPLVGVSLSVLVGFVSSFLGIGGGIIHVPGLVHLLGFPVHLATATSHFILSFMTHAGTAVHLAGGVFRHGLHRTLALGAGVVAGAQLGAWLSSRIRGAWILRALALALAGAGVRIIIGVIHGS
jgi:uncharacterized membrane protein YfcA